MAVGQVYKACYGRLGSFLWSDHINHDLSLIYYCRDPHLFNGKQDGRGQDYYLCILYIKFHKGQAKTEAMVRTAGDQW